MKKQKLELTWIGKEKRPRLEPRILIEDKTLSYRAEADAPVDNGETLDLFTEKEAGANPAFDDNILIQGDNLLALKALEQRYAGKVKCVFIDPPYNTGSAFTHYDDGLEHSMWLSLIRDRLELIKNLMAEDGSLWITIDDNECHYLKVVCDEVFGRGNFVANAIWQKKYSPQNDAKWLSDNHDHILIYAKNKKSWRPNLLPRSEAMNKRYKNPDNDPRGAWKPADLSVKTYSASNDYHITTPSGRTINPPKSRCWAISKTRLMELNADNRIWFGKSGNNVPSLKKFLTEVKAGSTTTTIWTYQEVGHNQEAKKEIKKFDENIVFDTPKPEKLMERVITLATSPGDLILDSFAGSGTTGAVAHKMGRRWIMVELGEHCHTHIVPRLQKVINGEDRGGISKAVNWQGGGGFRYYRLATSLLKKDTWGNWVINPEYNAEMLAEAMCKHMGYTYAPSQSHFWQHGFASENNYIYVTTGTLSNAQLQVISHEVGDNSLLICCKGFIAKADEFPNLSLKKIPQAVLHKCEWDQDDYSFNINVLPEEDDDEDGNADV
ncbi:site-specific DNA-methyltransferase [Candidatus Venteria ishoeyi]|uniref:site-specific DNA-methyltransferase (adenine-specific) n=1 Tax=Candidatus Venteria ishoeyi TaxID=1899563 RepID=A0A1H6F565_9GAMM|nr:site-specific DNA-methyltransferase [Candidatus Venteria ishoeyi]SEH04165.1 Modification methylase BamHI [Candidatus Venteria ishoeyi]